MHVKNLVLLAALAASLLAGSCGPAGTASSTAGSSEPEGIYYDGVEVTEDTTEILPGPSSSLEELVSLKDTLIGLQTIRFEGREPTLDELALLHETWPGVQVDYTVTVGGVTVTPDAESLDLSGLRHADIDRALESLKLLPALKTVNLGGAPVAPAEGDPAAAPVPAVPLEEAVQLADIGRFQEAFPQVVFDYHVDLFGKVISILDTQMDFNGIAMDDNGEAVKAILPYMPNCTYVNMERTGVPNEAMAAIRDQFPGVKVVWRIWFGRYFTCRTDAEKILAATLDGNCTGANSADLKYCTECRYLDLGHNTHLDDISFVQYMPKLEVAILAINSWSDASPLAYCTNLEYLEIFNTKCTDLTPLKGLKNLRHLNCAYLWGLSDISPLFEMTWLDRLWVGSANAVPRGTLNALVAALPNTEVNITVNGDPTGGTWRHNPRYNLLRQQFGYRQQDYAFY